MPTISLQTALSVIDDLAPGGSFIYHTGDLASDRLRDGELDDMATYLYGLAAPSYFVIGGEEDLYIIYGKGQGSLTQARIGDSSYRYIYTKGGRSPGNRHG